MNLFKRLIAVLSINPRQDEIDEDWERLTGKVFELIKERDALKNELCFSNKNSELWRAASHEQTAEIDRLRLKLRERKKHLREANRAAERLSLRLERPKALEAELFQQNHYLWKRVNELEAKLQSVTNDYQVLAQTIP